MDWTPPFPRHKLVYRGAPGQESVSVKHEVRMRWRTNCSLRTTQVDEFVIDENRQAAETRTIHGARRNRTNVRALWAPFLRLAFIDR